VDAFAFAMSFQLPMPVLNEPDNFTVRPAVRFRSPAGWLELGCVTKAKPLSQVMSLLASRFTVVPVPSRLISAVSLICVVLPPLSAKPSEPGVVLDAAPEMTMSFGSSSSVPPGPMSSRASATDWIFDFAEISTAPPDLGPRAAMAPSITVLPSLHTIAVPPVPCALDTSMRLPASIEVVVALGSAGAEGKRSM
jgi:hypothetical protein